MIKYIISKNEHTCNESDAEHVLYKHSECNWEHTKRTEKRTITSSICQKDAKLIIENALKQDWFVYKNGKQMIF